MPAVQTKADNVRTTPGAWRRMPVQSAGLHLQNRVEMLRRTRLMIGGSAAIVWGGLAFIGVMLAWFWIDLVLGLSPAIRVFAWGTAALTLFVLATWLWIRTRSDSIAARLAAQLDEAADSRGEIRSGLDLAGKERRGLSPQCPDLSTQLADIAVRRAAWLASGVTPGAIASPAPLVRAIALAIGAGFVLAIAGMIGPRMAWTEIKRFFNPWGDHPPWTRYEFSISPEGSSLRYGDDLEIQASVSGPNVDQLELVLVPPAADRKTNISDVEPIDVLPMFADRDGRWHASIASIEEPFDYFLRVRNERSHAYSIDVITVPVIEDVHVEVTAPLYAGMSPYRGTVREGGVNGLPQTEVVVTVSSNRPLSGGLLTYTLEETGSPIPMESGSEPNTVTGRFRISGNGQVSLMVTDVGGEKSISPSVFPVTLLEDQSPIIRILQPRSVSFATPTATLPVQAAAEDDYGLRRCELFRSLNNSRSLPREMEFSSGNPRRAQPTQLLPLAKYGLKPGDEIRLFARAEDNDPNGPNAPVGKGAESSLVTVRIISEEDFQRFRQQKAGMDMMMSRHQQARRRMEQIAEAMKDLHEKLKSEPADSPLADEMRKQLNELAEQMEKEASAIQDLADKPLPLDLDQKLSPQLEQMAETMRDLAEQMKQAASNPDMSAQDAAQEMMEQLQALNQQQEQHEQGAMEPMKRLAQVLPLKQNEVAFAQLVMKQKELADRLQSIRNQNPDDDPELQARMRELAEDQHRIREQLDDLLDQIEENAESLPDEPEFEQLRSTAQEFAQAVRESGASGDMTEAESQLSQFDNELGPELSQQAAELLEQFLSKPGAGGMGQEASDCLPAFSPSLGSSMQTTLDQLAPSPGMGLPGTGMAGSGGYSTQMSTADNVGMYGNEPMIDPSSGAGQDSNQDSGGMYLSPETVRDGQDSTGFTAGQTNPAWGGGELGVPIQYRRQAGTYLQHLAEELEK